MKGSDNVLVQEFNENSNVRSVQKYLRNISNNYSSIPSVIPDGIFGDQTENSVLEFQKYFGLEPTGVVDFETWNKLVEVDALVTEVNREAFPAFIFPESNPSIKPGESNLNMYVIQAMIYVISLKNNSIPPVTINGVLDRQTEEAVKIIQGLFGVAQDGIVDKFVYELIAILYEVYVSRNRVENAK